MDWEVCGHDLQCAAAPLQAASREPLQARANGGAALRDTPVPREPALAGAPEGEERLVYQAPPHLVATADMDDTQRALVHLPADRRAAALREPPAAPPNAPRAPAAVVLHEWTLTPSCTGGASVARLAETRAVYVFMGEADYDVTTPRHGREVRFAGVAQVGVTPAAAEGLGTVLAQVHYHHGLDGYGMSVVRSGGASRDAAASRVSGSGAAAYYVQLDPSLAGAVPRRDASRDAVARVAWAMARLAYVPARDGPVPHLGAAFERGYLREARALGCGALAEEVWETFQDYV
jgi:hypothetical protein